MSTGIEWTDETWNPVTGCTEVSPGCDHCYAKTMHERFNGPGSFATVTLHPERLEKALGWRKPRKVFVNSMSDLFHKDVPDEYIAKVFAVMAVAEQHTFQVLTKRHGRMRSLLSGDFRTQVAEEVTDLMARDRRPRHWPVKLDTRLPSGNLWGPIDWPLPNVWLGVSVENQQWADIRIPALLDTPAAVRFLSCEPLLGPVYTGLSPHNGTPPLIDWIIAGGESGHGARPMHPDWARDLRDQAVEHGAAFHFKQWGEWLPFQQQTPEDIHRRLEVGRRALHHFGGDVRTRRVGKKMAGRLLDGRTWDEYPEAVA